MNFDHLFRDYELKLDYVRAQYDRLWRRFDFFVSVQLALFGFLGYLSFEKEHVELAVLPSALGLAVSLLGYVIGAQDRALVEAYRRRATAAAERIARAPEGAEWFAHDHAAADVGAEFTGLRSWYWPALSMTRLPATLGLALAVVWLVVLLFWGRMMDRPAGAPPAPDGAAATMPARGTG